MHTRIWVAVMAAWSFWVFPKDQALAERLNFSFYTNTEGLPQRQVLAITRDEHGYLWVGTYGGLSRFNGRNFLTLRTHHGLSSNAIQDIVAVGGGRLWVGTSGGGVCLVEDLRATRCFHAPQVLASEEVLDLEEDSADSVWVGGFDGVTRLFFDGSSQRFSDAEGRVLRNVWSIKKVGQRIIVGFSGGLAEIRDNRAQLLPVHIPDGGVRALLPTQRWLYVGCERGLFRLPANLTAQQPELLVPNITVQDLAGDENNVWAATRTGLVRWDGKDAHHITAKHGLPSEVVHRIFLDHEGILWIGTEEGLGKLVPGPFLTFTAADGLPHNFVRAIAEDAKGRILVGTRNGLVVGETSGPYPRFRTLFTGKRVYAILPLPDGELWVATNAGVFQLRNDRTVRLLREEHGLPDRFTFALAFDPNTDELWLGTWSGTACLKKGKLVPLPAPLASARPLSMHVDKRGRLWIGLRDGKVMVRERNGNTKVLGAAEGFSDQVVWSIASDEQGVWLGTNGDGAFYVSERGISRWDTSKGLVDDFIWQVLPDKKGRVWFFTSQGLDRLEGGNIRHFGAHDGLPDLEGSASACFQDSRGNLWFGTGSGLVRYDPHAEAKALAPPQVLLESATFGNGVAVQPGMQLPATHGRVVFSVVSLTLRNEKALRYRYRLLPAQPSWS
ncbi:MAG: two-component regulator propeller domain-containing protein, partial [Thermoanaerobaculum sp.]